MRQNILLEIIFTATLSVILALVLTYPTALTLTTSFIGDGGDNYEHAAYQSLFAKQLKEGNYPFSYTTFWRYPIGFDFSRGFDSYISVITGGLLSLIVGMPLAYNLTLYLLLIANGVCSYLFFRFLSNSRLLGVAGMIMYGFSFYALSKTGSHPNLLFIGSVPLFSLSILRLFRKTYLNFFDLFLPFMALSLASLGSGQYFIILILFSLLYLTLLYFFFPSIFITFREKILHYKRPLGLASLIFFLIFLLFYSPYIFAVITGTFTISERESILYTLTPSFTDFIAPNSYIETLSSLIAKSAGQPSIEKVVFAGWIELIFFVAFFKSRIQSRIKGLTVIAFLIPFIFALGYGRDNSFFLLPYRFLSLFYPFKIIAEPGRYFIIFYFFMTLGVILFLSSIQNKQKKLLFTLIFLILILLERIPLSFHTTDTLAKDHYINVVKGQETQAVLDIPVNPFYARYDMLSFYYDKPIVNGYFHWSANTRESLSFVTNEDLLKRYTCSEADKVYTHGLNYFEEDKRDRELLATLQNYGIRTIVIHKDDKFFYPVCKNVRIRLSRLVPFITPLRSTTETQQEKISTEAWDGKPSFSLYFPTDGTFYLDGAYLATENNASFFITQNGLPVDFKYNWTVSSDGRGSELFPKNTISTKVKMGAILSIQTFDDVDHTWFSLWYRYVPENASPLSFQPALEKIYEDKKAIIYSIRE